MRKGTWSLPPTTLLGCLANQPATQIKGRRIGRNPARSVGAIDKRSPEPARGEKGAGFKSLRDTWADTTTAHGRLMLTVLGGLAEFERELIRTRTGEGRERAKARGVILGRKPKLTTHQRREAIARREAGEVLADIARSYNVSRSTISRLTRRRHAASQLISLHT
jgi:Mor family transcriptional regulator